MTGFSVIDYFFDQKDKKEPFDAKAFKTVLDEVGLETKARLEKIYPGSKIRVELQDHYRDFERQKEYQATGASKATISLHNFGAAGDYDIYIDGNLYTGDGKGEHGSTKPYQVLGGVAQDKGLFWGWPGDSRHVAATRFVDQFITQYPVEAERTEVKDWYKSYSDRSPAGYRPLMTVLDNIYNTYNENRVWVGDERTMDALLDPIRPIDDKAFNTMIMQTGGFE